MFSLIDIIAISLSTILISSGLYFGFIHSLGNIIGWVAGFIISAFISVYALNHFSWMVNPVYAVLLFFFLFALISAIVGWIADVIAKLWKIAKWIPFSKLINSILGGILGIVEAFLVLVGLDGFVQYALPISELQKAFTDSVILSFVRSALSFLQPVIQSFFV